MGQKEKEVKKFKVRMYACLHCTIYKCHHIFSRFIYNNCQYFMPTLHELLSLFQADLQAEKEKVHSMEKAALQKDKELDQCKVCIQYRFFPCVNSTMCLSLQVAGRHTHHVLCNFATTAFHFVSHCNCGLSCTSMGILQQTRWPVYMYTNQIVSFCACVHDCMLAFR